jgi:hypothetical protein
MLQNLSEKLQLKEEKNLLIQGLPSSIEKQFAKLAFAKNVTPLLKARKIDFALVFALSESQLKGILRDVLPALNEDATFWIAYPKVTSKIATDLNRHYSWNCLKDAGFESACQVPLDHVWMALRFQRSETLIPVVEEEVEIEVEEFASVAQIDVKTIMVKPPADFVKLLRRSKAAASFFDTLPVSDKKEYVSWITGAKREDARSRRMEMAVDKLLAGKRNPSEK